MITAEQLIAQDLKHIWHPCSRMKEFESHPPLIVERAQGSYLHTNKGPVIDGISSWWCKSLGHGHPSIIEAINQQLSRFEHVISANTTHSILAELGEELSKISNKQHVFFASDGSCAVEIAMKMAIQANQLKGQAHKTEFIALKNGYHGETFGALSVSDLGIYKQDYPSSLACHFIKNIPYVFGENSPLNPTSNWDWSVVEEELNLIHHSVAAIILEPIVQGAGGMQCYAAEFLKKLAKWSKSKGIYLIVDEIMTGIGRTGKWLAIEHAGIDPDLICLSKGLTSGSIPMSCVMVDHSLFSLFYDEYDQGKSFLHSHTHSGNSLAASAALATLKTMHQEKIIEQTQDLGKQLFSHLEQVAALSGKLTQIRGIGGIVAADLVETNHLKIGNKVAQCALERGALIRPIGRTIYWLPPLNTNKEIIGKLAEITLHSIEEAYANLKS